MGKLLKKFFHNKRAVTPIFSELLLTVIAVAAMSIAATATYVITTNLRENMSERVTVEDVWFNSETQAVSLYLLNVGRVDVSILNVYINHVAYPVNFDLAVDSNESFSIPYHWVSGEIYYIDLVTQRGTHIASDYKAP